MAKVLFYFPVPGKACRAVWFACAKKLHSRGILWEKKEKAADFLMVESISFFALTYGVVEL